MFSTHSNASQTVAQTGRLGIKIRMRTSPNYVRGGGKKHSSIFFFPVDLRKKKNVISRETIVCNGENGKKQDIPFPFLLLVSFSIQWCGKFLPTGNFPPLYKITFVLKYLDFIKPILLVLYSMFDILK